MRVVRDLYARAAAAPEAAAAVFACVGAREWMPVNAPGVGAAPHRVGDATFGRDSVNFAHLGSRGAHEVRDEAQVGNPDKFHERQVDDPYLEDLQVEDRNVKDIADRSEDVEYDMSRPQAPQDDGPF